MKTQIISSMGSFILGTGATLTVLASWLGTTDLQAIKDSVQNYVMESEVQASALLGEYNVTVDQANAEIGAYKDALEQANSNIDTLILAYQQQEQQAQQDLAELQTELDNLYARMDSQYEHDINHFIEEANYQIDTANQEVADTKEYVDEIIENSLASDIAQNGERHQLDTTGDKSVNDITGIVE